MHVTESSQQYSNDSNDCLDKLIEAASVELIQSHQKNVSSNTTCHVHQQLNNNTFFDASPHRLSSNRPTEPVEKFYANFVPVLAATKLLSICFSPAPGAVICRAYA